MPGTGRARLSRGFRGLAGRRAPGLEQSLQFELFGIVQRRIPGLGHQFVESSDRGFLDDQTVQGRFQFRGGARGIRRQADRRGQLG